MHMRLEDVALVATLVAFLLLIVKFSAPLLPFPAPW